VLGDRLHQLGDVGVVAPGVAEFGGDRLEGFFQSLKKNYGSTLAHHKKIAIAYNF
jgi:hypothetical protein